MPLLVGLNLNDGSRESLTFKDLRQILPEIKYIKVPIGVFKHSTNKSQVYKIIVDGKTTEYKEFKYHQCKLENIKTFDQDKVTKLIAERNEILAASVKKDSSNEFI